MNYIMFPIGGRLPSIHIPYRKHYPGLPVLPPIAPCLRARGPKYFGPRNHAPKACSKGDLGMGKSPSLVLIRGLRENGGVEAYKEKPAPFWERENGDMARGPRPCELGPFPLSETVSNPGAPTVSIPAPGPFGRFARTGLPGPRAPLSRRPCNRPARSAEAAQAPFPIVFPSRPRSSVAAPCSA